MAGVLRWCGAPFLCAVTGGMSAVFGGFCEEEIGVWCFVLCGVCVVERVVFGVRVSL